MAMDAHEAREHLEMVDRIPTRAEQEPVRIIPGLVIVWGLGAAGIDAGQQLYFSHIGGSAGLWLAFAAFALGMLYSIAVSISIARNHRFERITVTEMRMGQVTGAVWFTVVAAVWSMGAAILMLMSGFSGDRRGLAGGLILLASVLAANYAFPQTPGYALAAGFILGYAVPGFLFAAQGPSCEA